MSLSIVLSRALLGMHAPLVEVECHLTNGLPAFNIVGLPDTEVKESRDRVRAAIIQSGFDFPAKKITVNLAPADLPKESGRFDLPIAISILIASRQIITNSITDIEFAGELGLTGQIRPIRGALIMAHQASSEHHSFILPKPNAIQAALLPNTMVYGADTLTQVAAHLNKTATLLPITTDQAQQQLPISTTNTEHVPDLADVCGQETARFALEIAAAGQHSLLMIGSPGTGKSMLAHRLPSILPPLSEQELTSVWSLQSLCSHHQDRYTQQRPFRSPHHSSSAIALVGGGCQFHK